MALQLGGAEEGEEDGVGVGAVEGAILLADLAGDDGDAYLLLGEVVGRRGGGMVEEGEELAAEIAQAVAQAHGVGIVEGLGDEGIEAPMQAELAPLEERGRQRGPLGLKGDGVVEQNYGDSLPNTVIHAGPWVRGAPLGLKWTLNSGQ